MKLAVFAMMATVAVALVGCASPRGGGMSGGEGFAIVTPPLTTHVKQGETKEITVSLSRGEYFKRDVTLDIKASEGISVTPHEATIKASEKTDVHLRIAVPKNAAMGEYKIFLTGTPETGQPTSTEVKVKVVAP